METELFCTIYSDSDILGKNQIECRFRVLKEFSEKRLDIELFDIFKRNSDIENITYTITACIKTYKRRNKPFSAILYPVMIPFSFPKSWSKWNNVIFK